MKHTELIARLEPFAQGLGKAILREAVSAIEALETERDALQAEVARLKSELSVTDVLLEECKMDWSGDMTQIEVEHKHEIDALQAQLAAAQGQEPIGTVRPWGIEWEQSYSGHKRNEGMKLYAAPIPQQVAEPSHAAIHMEHCFQPPYETSCKYGDSDCPAQQAQPERAPLSLEEINAEARELDDAALECGFRTGVRWAEQRHGIKQGGQHD